MYPPKEVLKILRSLGKSRKSQNSSLISEEKVGKVQIIVAAVAIAVRKNIVLAIFAD